MLGECSRRMPRISRSPTFIRLMARLALVAMLLMTLAPTISRSLESNDGLAGNGSMLMAIRICTTAGLQTKLLTLVLPGASAEQSNVDDPASDPYGADDACVYCSMITPIPVLLLHGLLPLNPVAPDFSVHVTGLHTLRNRRGLGAQAPPLFL